MHLTISVRPSIVGAITLDPGLADRLMETYNVSLVVDNPDTHEGRFYSIRLFGDSLKSISDAKLVVENALQSESDAISGKTQIHMVMFVYLLLYTIYLDRNDRCRPGPICGKIHDWPFLRDFDAVMKRKLNCIYFLNVCSLMC